jgi:hypothetical protein
MLPLYFRDRHTVLYQFLVSTLLLLREVAMEDSTVTLSNRCSGGELGVVLRFE